MTTTPLGIPKYSLTDNADIAAKLNAIADQVDTLITQLENTVTTQSFPPVERKLSRTTNYSLNNGTNPIAGWDATDYSVGDTTYTTGLITIHTPGHYVWGATVIFPGDPNASRVDVFVQKNGASINEGANDTSLRTGNSMALTAGSGAISVPMAAGDTLQLCIYYSGTARLDGVTPRFFAVRRVG